ncbi:MAG: hypothetical protein Q9228_006650, partial [Teloschistes exilis]
EYGPHDPDAPRTHHENHGRNSKLKHHWAINLEKEVMSEDLLGLAVDFSNLPVPDATEMDEALRMRLARESKRYGDAITQLLNVRKARDAIWDQAWTTKARLERLVEHLEGVEGDENEELQAQWDRKLGDSWWTQL